jgi:DNA-binding CsgD family transcriptional regulator/PAS domain-containing protein
MIGERMPLTTLADLSDVVGLIYDCALDARAWPLALERIRRFRDAAVAGISVVDTVNNDMRANVFVGLSDHATSELHQTYAALMPPPLYDSRNLVVDEVYCTSDFMDYEEFTRGRFFQEWARPNGLLDTSSSCLMKDQKRFAMAACMLPRLASERDRELGLLLAPHIRRAVTISDLLDSRLVEVGYLEKTLGALTIGVVVTDERARVLFANQVAERMFAAAETIQSRRGLLHTHSAHTTSALWNAIRQASQEETGLGVTGIGIPAPDIEGARGAVLHVLPLERRSGGAVMDGNVGHQVAIFVAEGDRSGFVPMDVVMAVYGLTHTESLVLARIGQGETCEEIAEAMRVASSTIRTHLNHLLAKTGKRRQAELIKLVEQFSVPIRG